MLLRVRDILVLSIALGVRRGASSESRIPEMRSRASSGSFPSKMNRLAASKATRRGLRGFDMVIRLKDIRLEPQALRWRPSDARLFQASSQRWNPLGVIS